MENEINTNPPPEPELIGQELPAALPPGPPQVDPEALKAQRKIVISIVAAVLVFVSLIVLAVIGLLQPGTPTDKIRDIFIIFMAIESLLIGLTLVILIVQLARLINLLQNEIKPILNSTNETVSTLRGTVNFLSDSLAEPVIKLNESLAAFSQIRQFFKTIRKK